MGQKGPNQEETAPYLAFRREYMIAAVYGRGSYTSVTKE